MAFPRSSSFAKYPNPPEVNVGDYVSIKLSRTNYYMWKELMKVFIENQGMAGFINGTIPAPPEKITVPDVKSTDGRLMEMENQEYQAWKRSDSRLLRWIVSTLNEDVLVHVFNSKTAREAWTSLEKLLTQPFVYATQNVSQNDRGGENLSKYLPLHKAALRGDWESAKEFFEKEPDAVRAVVTGGLETALIVAARSSRRNHFVKELVHLMSPCDLALVDSFGLTALHVAAASGNTEAAKLLVNKNPFLSHLRDTTKSLPLHRAALFGKGEMVLYLLTVTKEDVEQIPSDHQNAKLIAGDNVEQKPFDGESGVILVDNLITSGLYDIALSLIQQNPKLAWGDPFVPSPLDAIARKRSAFPSGMRLNFWEQLIYSCIPLKLGTFAKHGSGDIENAAANIVSVSQRLPLIFWETIETLVPQIKNIREKKLIHHQAILLVKCLCAEAIKLDYPKAAELLEAPLKFATTIGVHEVVEEIVWSFPSALYARSEQNQTLFHLAIANRRENVYNLIYQFEDSRHILIATPDILMNNGLHLAGCLGPQQQLNLRADAAGAALQMQRELQWFKEVEKFALPQSKEQGNTTAKTPPMLFTETHKDLVKEGEQWMKDTANSCTIVAALIATVVFAAAITVPGGNNSDTGLPVFSHNKAFAIFAISDALALFSSTSSVLMFLSILTSRYAEDDFLRALPKRLIISLVTLFLSIISMMVAFSTTLYLVFGNNKAWILIPVIALASLPVTLFAFLQFPLLVDMIKSTYYPGIFYKQSDRIIF